MPSLGLNAAFGLATRLLGVRADPYRAFNFLVEIEGIISGGFSECTGLQVETEIVDYREGGQNDYVHRFAGAVRYPPLILKHGLTPIDGLWEWHQEWVQTRVLTRRNGTIYLLDKQGQTAMSWDVIGAFPVKWTGPELRAESATVAIESIELSHRGLSRPRSANASSILAAVGAVLSGSISG